MKPLDRPYGEKTADALRFITEAALANRACPSNEEIARVAGFGTSSTASKCVRFLCDQGRIEYRRRGTDRVVYVKSVDRCTFDVHQGVHNIVSRAAAVFDTTVRDILSDSKFREHVRARWAVMLVATEIGYPPTTLGRAVSRNHATVNYGLGEARRLSDRSIAYRNQLTRLRSYFLPEEELAA